MSSHLARQSAAITPDRQQLVHAANAGAIEIVTDSNSWLVYPATSDAGGPLPVPVPAAAWHAVWSSLTPHERAQAKTRRQASLSRLDAAFLGWHGAAASLSPEQLVHTECMQAQRDRLQLESDVWPSLPAATLLRAQICGDLAPRAAGASLWLDIDLDGASVLLAARHDVKVAPSDALTHNWLCQQARELGVNSSCHLNVALRDLGPDSLDIAVLTARLSGADIQSCAVACDAVKPKGFLLVRFLGAVLPEVMDWARGRNLHIVRCYQGVEQALFPGGFQLAGPQGGSLLLLQKPERKKIVPSAIKPRTPLDSVNFYRLDFAGLSDVSQDSLDHMLDMLAALTPNPEAGRGLSAAPPHPGNFVFAWNDAAGAAVAGFFDARTHCLIALLTPGHTALLQALSSAVFWVLGSQLTRATVITNIASDAMRPDSRDDASPDIAAALNSIMTAAATSGSAATCQTFSLEHGVTLQVGYPISYLERASPAQRLNIPHSEVALAESLALGDVPISQPTPFVETMLQQRWLKTGQGEEKDAAVKPHPEAHQLIGALLAMDDEWRDKGAHPVAGPAASHEAYQITLLAQASRKRFLQGVRDLSWSPWSVWQRALSLSALADASAGPQRVVCLGDPGLLSLTLAALGHAVTLYEVDDYTLAFIKRFATQRQLPITLVDQDPRDPLAPETLGLFDIAVAQPWPNRESVGLFLSRAVALTRVGGWVASSLPPDATADANALVAKWNTSLCSWWALQGRHHRAQLEPMPQPLRDQQPNKPASGQIQVMQQRSDWCIWQRLREGPLVPAPDAFYAPLTLFRETYARHETSCGILTQTVAQPQLLTAQHMVWFLEAFARESGTQLLQSQGFISEAVGGAWHVVFCPTSSPVYGAGFVLCACNCEEASIRTLVHPHREQTSNILRNLFIAAYKDCQVSPRLAVNGSLHTWHLS